MGSGLSYYSDKAPLPRVYAAGLSATSHLRGDPTTFGVEVRKVRAVAEEDLVDAAGAEELPRMIGSRALAHRRGELRAADGG